MKTYHKILMILFSLSLFAYGDPGYTSHDIEMSFEISEAAMSTFIQTQVFPQPEGTYGTDYYKVRITAPRVELHPESIVFKATITGYVTVGSTTIPYDYAIDNSITIPTIDLSLQGIIGTLQGIPDQINNQDGPQWLKDIIIAAYNNLNLTVYPQRILDQINQPIPDAIDINVNDITCGFEIVEDAMQISITVKILERAPYNDGRWFINEFEGDIGFQFRSNVRIDILKYAVYSQNRGEVVVDVNNPGITLQPGQWSNTIQVSDGSEIDDDDYYIIKVVFGSDFGWYGISYRINLMWQGAENWTDLNVIVGTL